MKIKQDFQGTQNYLMSSDDLEIYTVKKLKVLKRGFFGSDAV